MGGNVSKAEDVSRQVVESVLSIQNEISNTCASNTSQINNIKFKIIDSNVDIGTIDQKNYSNFDSKCLISSELDNKISEEVQNQANQIAEAINKGLGIGVNVTDSKVTSEQITKLSTELRNIVKNNCTNSFIQQNTIDFFIEGSNVTIGAIDMENNLTATTDCVMKNIEKSTTYTQIKNTVDQATKSANEGIFGDLGTILIIIVVAIILIAGLGAYNKKKKSEPVRNTKNIPVVSNVEPIPSAV